MVFAGPRERRQETIIMYDHIGLKVKDLDASVAFLTAVLSTWLHALLEGDASAGLDQETHPRFGSSGSSARSAGVHVAFRRRTATVDTFHETGLKVGGRDNGGRGCGRIQPKYYAAFLRTRT